MSILAAPSLVDQPIMSDTVGPFLLLVLFIALVAAALKRDDAVAIAREFVKLYVAFAIGFAVFCLALFLLGNPNVS